jgi:BTB/POZ domain-containing protein KCTD9
MSKPKKLTYEDSCRELQKAGWLAPGIVPGFPLKRPSYDDDGVLGVRLFRTQTKDKILEHLTLPRTFFGRSEIRNVSFARTDLSESTFMLE